MDPDPFFDLDWPKLLDSDREELLQGATIGGVPKLSPDPDGGRRGDGGQAEHGELSGLGVRGDRVRFRGRGAIERRRYQANPWPIQRHFIKKACG